MSEADDAVTRPRSAVRALVRTVAVYASRGPWPALRALWRFASAPLAVVAASLPTDGIVVDVGCGQGHFLRFCHERGVRRLVGIEPSLRGLSRARRCLPPHVLLVHGCAQHLPVRKVDCVVALDVLYLLEHRQQEMFIAAVASALRPGGVLLVKTMDPGRRYRQAINRLQEWCAVKVLRITLGRDFFFRSVDEWVSLCERYGMRARGVPLWRGYVHPHVLIVARADDRADLPRYRGLVHEAGGREVRS